MLRAYEHDETFLVLVLVLLVLRLSLLTAGGSIGNRVNWGLRGRPGRCTASMS